MRRRKGTPAPPGTRVGRSYAGLGLFATRPYKKGERVIEYVGRVLSEKEADESNSLYLFYINPKVTIDGRPAMNPAGYINHSCRPNCEVTLWRGHVYIKAIKAIKPGEEFSYDYGEEYYVDHIAPHGCKCGAPRHLHQRAVERARNEKAKKRR